MQFDFDEFFKSKKFIFTEGGSETTFIYNYNYALENFCLFKIYLDDSNLPLLKSYYREYLIKLRPFSDTLMFDTATWRASPDYICHLGLNQDSINFIHFKAAQVLIDLQQEFAKEKVTLIIGGQLGPRGDGYNPKNKMTIDEAETYHSAQIRAMKQSGIQIVNVLTLNYIEEALGIAKAASKIGIDYSISFTLHTDGKLINGEDYNQIVNQIDSYSHQQGLKQPAFYGINCCHPLHATKCLQNKQNERIRMFRSNSSSKSHQELDELTCLDEGDIEELRESVSSMIAGTSLRIIGGCCGTNNNHVSEMARKLTQQAQDAN